MCYYNKGAMETLNIIVTGILLIGILWLMFGKPAS